MEITLAFDGFSAKGQTRSLGAFSQSDCHKQRHWSSALSLKPQIQGWNYAVVILA